MAKSPQGFIVVLPGEIIEIAQDDDISWLTYQQFGNLVGNLTDMIVAEQQWQPVIDAAWEMRAEEDYYNAKDPMAEIHTHDTKLKRRLMEYVVKYPQLCQLTEDDEQGGLRFEIAKSRISIRLTAPYSDERRETARVSGKQAIQNLKVTMDK